MRKHDIAIVVLAAVVTGFGAACANSEAVASNVGQRDSGADGTAQKDGSNDTIAPNLDGAQDVLSQNDAADAPIDSSMDAPIHDAIPEACAPGTSWCAGLALMTCGEGGVSSVTCPNACDPTLGCVMCNPGAANCTGSLSSYCRYDGSGWNTEECDSIQGMSCDSGTGMCDGACSHINLGSSYIGCDYFPTVTLNPVWSGFHFSAAVGNTAATPATITVTQGSNTVSITTVAANSLQIIHLPWVTALKGGDIDSDAVPPDPGNSTLVTQGAYRLRSNVPVTVYQFSPVEYALSVTNCPTYDLADACYSYSNDASLLIPVNTWTGQYTVLSWPSDQVNSGFIAITASQDATQVTVTGLGTFTTGGGLSASGGTVTLNAGDVLQGIATHTTAFGTYGSDLSGTTVTSTKPVQVIGGQSCANVPTASTGYCDHIEEVMFPTETLGSDYFVTIPAAPTGTSPHVVRIAAIQANTVVTFDPASIHAQATLQPGQAPLQLTSITQDVHVTSSLPIIVAQYMQGSSSVASGKGDPSESLAIPSHQYRSSYLFLAPSNYDQNFVNIIAPASATVTLDSAAVTSGWTTIGSTTFHVARVLLANTDVHSITGTSPFGIVVYGYGIDTSYMYPGGLDLMK